MCRRCISSSKAAAAVAFLAVRALDVLLAAALVAAMMYLWCLAAGFSETLNPTAEKSVSISQAGRSEQKSSVEHRSEAAAEASVALESDSRSRQSEKSEKSGQERSEASAHTQASTQHAVQAADELSQQQGAAVVWKLGLAVLVSLDVCYTLSIAIGEFCEMQRIKISGSQYVLVVFFCVSSAVHIMHHEADASVV